MKRSLLVALAAALLAGGCGKDKLSDKQLRTRAARICNAAARKTGHIATPQAPTGAKTFLEKGIAVLAPEYRQLRALKPSSELAQVYAISMKAFSQKLDALQKTARRLDHGADPAIAMKTLQHRLAPLESTEDGAWQALEVPACLNR